MIGLDVKFATEKSLFVTSSVCSYWLLTKKFADSFHWITSISACMSSWRRRGRRTCWTRVRGSNRGTEQELQGRHLSGILSERRGLGRRDLNGSICLKLFFLISVFYRVVYACKQI